MNKKRGIIIGVIVAVLLIGIFGVTYALYSRTILGKNSELVMGDIYMHYKETKQLTLENVMPSETYDESKYFEFTIDGKNTSENDIWYEIVLPHGDVPAGKQEENRIDDGFLYLTLIETKGNVNETVVNANRYSMFRGKRIWTGVIPAETLEDTTITYKLYMWISDEIKIGNTSDADYSMEEWNNLFGSVKVNVNGDFERKEMPPQ